MQLSHVPSQPAPVAQWAKPLLIGHSACWPDGLRTLADLGTNPVWKGVFQLDWMLYEIKFSDRHRGSLLDTDLLSPKSHRLFQFHRI